MVISSESYRRLASRAPATVQGARAQYLAADQAPDFTASNAPAHVFAEEAGKAFDAAAVTGLIDLDLSETRGFACPATTPNLLARYLVIRDGEEFELAARATSVLCYAITGSGRSFQEDEVIEWRAGDAFLFPGGEPILSEAPAGNAVLFVVTDEPFVSMTGAIVPSMEDARVRSTHFVGRTIAARLEDMAKGAEQTPAQTILNFASAAFEGSGCVAPLMAAGIATLAPGTDQPSHCHDADTLSLCLQCEGVYSTIGADRIDWVINAAILTPAGAAHSQHNTGQSGMFSFFVQDRGPRPVRTWEPVRGDRAE